MQETYSICGYTRISVDLEEGRDNTSIENQKAIIEEFVRQKFPGSSLDLYVDRDRSGYTFEQREGYQAMRKGLMSHKYDILIVKDFSRFSRRNSRGLVELEDLRDAGVRAVAEWEVDDAVLAAERHRWLRDVLRQRSQAASLAARQNHCQAFSLSHNNYPPWYQKRRAAAHRFLHPMDKCCHRPYHSRYYVKGIHTFANIIKSSAIHSYFVTFICQFIM